MLKRFLLLTLFLFVLNNDVFGDTKGAGLNDGILYLMAMPYVSILLFGVFWFFQNKKTQTSS